MNEDPTTNQPQRHSVEVKGTLEILPSADSWVENGLPEAIEGQFSLWEKQGPEIRGKHRIHSCQDRKEVAFEGVDGTLRSIPAVHVRGNNLELGFPLDSDGLLVRGVSFVV